MKTTIYELLGMIKDGKAPKKIIYDGEIWTYDKNDYANENNWDLFDEYVLTDILNDEVEILDEDKPSEEIRKLQSEIDILTNKVEHYYSEVVSFRDKTRYLKDELKKLKEKK